MATKTATATKAPKVADRVVKAVQALRERGISIEEITAAWGLTVPASLKLVVDNTIGTDHSVYPMLMWVPTTTNRKTGDIPTAWVGETRERSYESCVGCPLRDKDCYSHNGTPSMAHSSMIRSLQARGEEVRFSLANALRRRSVGAKFARLSAIGDAARANPEEVRAAEKAVRAEGLGWLSYTHFWQEVAERGDQDLFVASANTLDDGDKALAAGFSRTVVVLPWDAYEQGRTFTTPAGEKGVICPALAAHSKGKRLTCNQCGLCDPQATGPRVVGFPDHGPGVKSKIKKLAATGVAWAKNLLIPL